ncbi:MAG TPA: tetratricopeptide repeat protein [Blastocatellia bacterium]|nr:tetratricopeptide repeat protein [Blastocatellia bacterium]
MISEEISHYRIIKKLDAGGMGEVYLAEDIRLKRKVAIKVLPASSMTNEQAKKRLLREAQATAALDHPNICAIHEVGEHGETAFIAMQYIEGSTLHRRIKNNPLSPAEIVDIGIQVAAALSEAHSHGIIHRDIKPHNVIITPRGQVKVLDFGLAKIVQDASAIQTTSPTESRLTDTGQIVGTVGYMSPEQLKDLPVDSRSDLFSLGVTLYECATGKSPFTGSSKIQISLQVIQHDPPGPSKVNPNIPFGLDEIILKALAKDVDARYQSADEMLADLKKMRAAIHDGSALNTRPMTQLPTSRLRMSTSIMTRRIQMVPFGVKAGLLMSLMALGVFVALSMRRPSTRQPSPEAKTWYDRGTEGIRSGAYYQASKALEQAIQIDHGFALARARLAETYAEMDYSDKAKEELLRAMALVPERSSLPGVDGMYLDAIAATVRRDFTAAIGYYGNIAAQSPDSEKSSAYVDLGRSYEKNDNLDKAIKYYDDAAKADPQSAAAFLRLGILYGRRQHPEQAGEAFSKAETIYRAMSNQEGEAEVLYERGAMLRRSGRLTDARTQLENALEISQRANNKYQFVKTQLQLSSLYAAEGDTDRARDLAKDAMGMAQAGNIRDLATNGLLELGETLRLRGEFIDAAKYCKQALELARADKTRRTEARALYSLGSMNRQQGNIDEAIPLLEEAIAFYQPAGYRLETSRALLVLARARRDKGQYEVALNTFEETLRLARELDDPGMLAASHSSIGILLADEKERYLEALSHLDESYKINQSLGAKVDMGYDQMNRGRVLWKLGRYQEARAALDEAFKIADRPEASYKVVLAWVHLTNSLMALSERRFADAEAKGRQALELAGIQYKDVAVQAKCGIALAEASSGAPQSARKLCDEAIATAKEMNHPRLLSTSRMVLAEVLLLSNDPEGAKANALEAQAMFAQSAQKDSEWRAWLIAARASGLSGDKSTTIDYASRADALCAGLQQTWGVEAYEGYMRRPDIRTYRKQLSQLLVSSK